jgi:hypothetical protein
LSNRQSNVPNPLPLSRTLLWPLLSPSEPSENFNKTQSTILLFNAPQQPRPNLHGAWRISPDWLLARRALGRTDETATPTRARLLTAPTRSCQSWVVGECNFQNLHWPSKALVRRASSISPHCEASALTNLVRVQPLCTSLCVTEQSLLCCSMRFVAKGGFSKTQATPFCGSPIARASTRVRFCPWTDGRLVSSQSTSN